MPEPFVMEEFLNLLAGKQLGRDGMSRKVFEMAFSEDLVVKVEEGAGFFQNVMENHFWGHVEHTKFAKWFAPVKGISPNGRVLVMQRTQPAPKSTYPEMMPAFFTDFKYSNFGLIGDQLVCHDYGTCLLPTTGITGRMRKADWYDA